MVMCECLRLFGCSVVDLEVVAITICILLEHHLSRFIAFFAFVIVLSQAKIVRSFPSLLGALLRSSERYFHFNLILMNF